MCGLLGFVKDKKSKLTEAEFHLMKALFINTQRRGRDATGLFLADIETRKAIYVKNTLPANVFVLKHMNSNFIKEHKLFELNYSVCLGHCRRVTRGKSDVARAHPFLGRFEKEERNFVFVLTHNGTIKDYDLRGLGIERSLKESDTQALFGYMLSELKERVTPENASEVVPAVIADVMGSISDDGGYSIVVYSSVDNKVYAFRNSIQPLYVYQMDELFRKGEGNKKVSGIWYTSDPEIMRDAVCSLMGNLLEEEDVERVVHHKPVKLPEHTVFQLDSNGLVERMRFSPKREQFFTSSRDSSSSLEESFGRFGWFGSIKEKFRGNKKPKPLKPSGSTKDMVEIHLKDYKPGPHETELLQLQRKFQSGRSRDQGSEEDETRDLFDSFKPGF